MNKSVQQFFNLFQQVYMQSSMAINIEFHLNRLEFFITHTHTHASCACLFFSEEDRSQSYCVGCRWSAIYVDHCSCRWEIVSSFPVLLVTMLNRPCVIILEALTISLVSIIFASQKWIRDTVACLTWSPYNSISG